MEKLVEMIGKKNGYKEMDIWNCYKRISTNVEKLVEADLKADTDTIILLAIEYSLSLRLQMDYGNILYFVQEKLA